MAEKFIWVQSGGGNFPVSQVEVTEFNCVFKPQKIKPLREITDSELKEPFGIMKRIPEGIKMETAGDGGFIIEYTDDIEKVRAVWLKSIVSHYNHIMWMKDLLNISPKWHTGIKVIYSDIEKHKVNYPHLWI